MAQMCIPGKYNIVPMEVLMVLFGSFYLQHFHTKILV